MAATGFSGQRVVDWIEPLARAGYTARGVVYLIIGVFAVLAAIGGSDTKGSEGALVSLLGQPFGKVLLWIVIIGLIGYALWRLTQVVLDPDRHGHDATGLATRAMYLVSGLAYGSLAGFALGLVTQGFSGSGGGEGSGGGAASGLIAAAYGAGYGKALTWLIAIVMIGVGCFMIYKAWSDGFEKRLLAPPDKMRMLRPICRFGITARGIVFIILGGLLLNGAIRYSQTERPGLSDALEAVQGWTLGWLMLAAIGVGLIAFAAFSFVVARYRKIGT